MSMNQQAQAAGHIRPAIPANIFLWLIGAFLVIFLLWAGFTEIDRTIRAGGRSFPARNCRSYRIWRAGLSSRSWCALGRR
ncbi:hypothetical protein ACFSUK_14580 [Sphingobium scionense]